MCYWTTRAAPLVGGRCKKAQVGDLLLRLRVARRRDPIDPTKTRAQKTKVESFEGANGV